MAASVFSKVSTAAEARTVNCCLVTVVEGRIRRWEEVKGVDLRPEKVEKEREGEDEEDEPWRGREGEKIA
uniref:Putative ovule protein n=1 Tax=Solanum chacoense TaxID=4108 RepID=A0A0V0GHC5_SOLCH